MLRSYGKLRYDPRSKRTRFDPWWVILECDIGLSKYYRSMVEKDAFVTVQSRRWLEEKNIDANVSLSWPIRIKRFSTTPSAWGPHISVIRGEKPDRTDLWGKYEGKKICFEYNPEFINTNGRHWWFRAISKELEDIRLELGLTPQPTFKRSNGTVGVNPFHFTICFNNMN